MLVLGVEKGTVKRDAWESEFGPVISALKSRTDKLESILPDKTPNLRGPDISDKSESVFPENKLRVNPSSPLKPKPLQNEGKVVNPRYKRKVKPIFPESAKQMQKEGDVLLQATIDESGTPVDIVALTNLGFGLEDAAIEALKKSAFHPATMDDKPISKQVQIPYEFKLTFPYTDTVLIPAGEFQMGNDGSDAEDDEKPVHTVYVDAFYIDKYEVTNVEYKKFVDANPQWQKGRIPRKYHDGDYLKHWDGNNYPSSKGNHPVVYVSWYAAMAYAQWHGKRLPIEAEWEKAARGGLVGKKYVWGSSLDANKANYGENVGDTTPVATYDANGYGLYDMTGNVWEWCLDEYNADFYSTSPGA